MTPEARAEHCRRIAAHGGAVTRDRYGSAHMRAIGKAGAQATIATHGRAYWLGLMDRRGWHGRQRDTLADDLAFGRTLAQLSAE